jgi:hypothetical protein
MSLRANDYMHWWELAAESSQAMPLGLIDVPRDSWHFRTSGKDEPVQPLWEKRRPAISQLGQNRRWIYLVALALVFR